MKHRRRGSRKIKRYSNTFYKRTRFSKPNKRLFYQIGGSILALAVIVLLVYIIAFGIKNALDNRDLAQSQTEPSVESSEESSEESPEVSDAIPNETSETVIATQMPSTYLTSKTKAQTFMTNLKNSGANSVVIPMQNSGGYLLYNSQIPEASQWGTISKNAVDPSDIINAAKSEGLTPIAQINGFRDNAAANAGRNNTYYYSNQKNTTRLFTDFATKSKTRFLNPYKTVAREYLCNIVKELNSAGFSKVLIDGVEFPVSNFDKYTSTDANGVSKEAIMKQFIEELNATGANYILSYDWSQTGANSDSNIYGGDPSTYGAKVLSPIVDINSPPSSVKGNDTTSMISTVFNQIKQNAQSVDIIPEISQDNNKDAVLNALKSVSINSYILLQ